MNSLGRSTGEALSSLSLARLATLGGVASGRRVAWSRKDRRRENHLGLGVLEVLMHVKGKFAVAMLLVHTDHVGEGLEELRKGLG